MNVAMLLDMAAEAFGERGAIGVREHQTTFAELREQARALAASVPDDIACVATISPTTEHTPVALFGAAWAGATYAPLNYRLPETERTSLLARVQPAVVFHGSVGTSASPLPYVETPQRPAALLFTSGTTAAPKAAVLEHDALLAYILNTMEFGAADEDEATLLAVPPFHIAGVAAILSATFAGRRVVPLSRFDADTWLELAEAEGVTNAFLVPTMVARIADVLERRPETRPSSLRHLAYGGARMPAPVLERILALLPGVDFVNAYGLTETSSTVCVLGPEDHRNAQNGDDPSARARLASVGRPVSGVELRILGESGEQAPVDEVGDVQLRGDQVGGAYLDSEGRRSDDGWLLTGDRGWVDAEGYLFIEGRGDGTIIRGGENIAAAEIEDALLKHGDVAAAAVVGVPDDEWGEVPAAMIVARAGRDLDVDAVRNYVRAGLGSLKTPVVIVVRDELPLTASGKIVHRLVADELAANNARDNVP
jgi:acyl-CoA synthetase (AMP-forming)/AMP-acid ligase II